VLSQEDVTVRLQQAQKPRVARGLYLPVDQLENGDGKPKLKDMPKEMGGSGLALAE
jgi:hypothetical protein